MKPDDVKLSTYIDFGIENNEKDPNFKLARQCKNVQI